MTNKMFILFFRNRKCSTTILYQFLFIFYIPMERLSGPRNSVIFLFFISQFNNNIYDVDGIHLHTCKNTIDPKISMVIKQCFSPVN